MSNLDLRPAQWLKETFAFQYCAECGGDAEHHKAVPFMSNWFAQCLSDEPSDKPRYFECGICGHHHPAGFAGDCREDGSRFYPDVLDQRHGRLGWTEIPMPTSETDQ